MITLVKAKNVDCTIIQQIAYATWPDTYKTILSEEQIQFMLDWMYNTKTLTEQINNPNYQYWIIQKEGLAVGFLSLEINASQIHTAKIHKIYLLPEVQNQGLGKILIEKGLHQAKKAHQKTVQLNVNRNNSALGFYLKLGFSVLKEEDIPIGKGFLMEDYILEITL